MPKFLASAIKAPDATRVGDVDEAGDVLLTVMLRPATPVADGAGGMSHAEYAALYATPQASLDAVCAFAASHGLTVVSTEAAAHIVKLRGTYAQARAAFAPDEIGVFHTAAAGRFVARSGHLHLPHSLMDSVVAVMGFDHRPAARPHFRVAARAPVSYTPLQVAARYQFPQGLDGAGQTIALIELGGGYSDADMAAYFTGLGVNRTGTLVSVSVDGATNTPDTSANSPDGEVQLDIEVAGAVAPGADIAVYFAPNQNSGFVDAISAAVNDQVRSPSVISISWGGPAASYAAQDLSAFEQVLQQAGALGITVCAASGDNGSTDGLTDGQNHVDFPASSPYVLGCGGTSLPKTGPEVAWNDGSGGGATGGGYSAQFPRPAWQEGVSGFTGTMRGVPDVAGDADPQTGYQISIDGQAAVIGGTSAVAPLWAGLVALINQSVGRRIGFANPTLYANPAAFTDITAGNNGAFSAGPGWDPVTGLGRPVGPAVLALFKTPPATS